MANIDKNEMVIDETTGVWLAPYVSLHWAHDTSSPRQKVDGISNDEWNQNTIMKWLLEKARNIYSCNRPPEAAGALILPQFQYKDSPWIFAGVGPAPYSPDCKVAGCMIEYSYMGEDFFQASPHCVRTIHAEVRAVTAAARYGIVTHRAICYSVLKPCYNCTKVLLAAGIRKIYYAGAAYDEDRTKQLLTRAGVDAVLVPNILYL